jgi:hypothetical protein
MTPDLLDDYFELIDLKSGNVLDDFADLQSAIATLRRVEATHGADAIRRLSLMHVSGDDETLVALGDEFVALLHEEAMVNVAANLKQVAAA